jgi:beta-lactamase class A
MASLFESIYRETYLAPGQSEVLKEALANTIFRNELPRFLPGIMMHKTGQLDDVMCDVGVVSDGVDPILISIYTRTDLRGLCQPDYIADTAAAIYTAPKTPKSCC